MDYEALLEEADSNGISIKERPLIANDGRIRGTQILIRQNMPDCQKACVLAEELGHYHTTAGNILDQSDVSNQKQERTARLWAYNKMITLEKLVAAKEAGCRNGYEIAEHLNVTEEFLSDAIHCYQAKYGKGLQKDDYLILFEPFNIYKLVD
ncbi:ImmA/IrrE family metallo-endopeptidase [Clostridium sp. Marseille-P2415]|uniref:ImmA/IrrE family metallo-endopeptidase n=1 Tax=Clostridium sp. Marseille-P2415 TaxID=1805471 RepID=UPI0009888F2F|nr:ImmA/IrrE family metallo-endopeptidase [Clostridium sp. Marseille-P2415]